jgi:hypothetical protein
MERHSLSNFIVKISIELIILLLFKQFILARKLEWWKELKVDHSWTWNCLNICGGAVVLSSSGSRLGWT